MEHHEVLLTGMGAITSDGDWTLHSPRRVANLDATSASGTAENGAIANFALGDYLDSQKTYLDRCSALALAGCALALRDAGLSSADARDMSTFKSTSTHAAAQDASHHDDDNDSDEDADGDFGITLGTHLGCIETMKGFWDKVASGGVRSASPLLFSHSYFNSPISLCAIEFGLKGFHGTFCNRDQSGFDAVRAAFDAIRLGHARAVLCGGVEALTPARALFEPAQGGAKLGEASVFFVLEESTSAAQRGAHGLPFGDAWLESSRAQEETVRLLLGDCGGANGALWIAQQIKGDEGAASR